MRNVLRLICLSAVSIASCITLTGAKAGEAAGHEGRGLFLGAQTHFSQGWDIGLLSRLKELGGSAFRDGINWRRIEVSPGVYDFSSVEAYLAKAEELGMEPLLVFAGGHADYDDGFTPYTDTGRRAFATYVAEVVKAYPGRIKKIEVGNEYNTDAFVKGPFRNDFGLNYTLLVKEVAKSVKMADPEVDILCTGAHSVSIGYFRKVFENGALEFCDAISFHPYRDVPENVDVEIRRLRDLMQEFGGEKPLYVTEFGEWFEDRRDAPDFMLKMVSLLGASGVQTAYWYALLEQQWWPNMGLLDTDGSEMPAAKTFRFLQERVLPNGRPVRISDKRVDYLYEFGNDGKAFIVWGDAGRIHVTGDAKFFDAEGAPLANVPEVSVSPIIILGDALKVRIERDRAAYDALYQFGGEPWTYFARKPDGTEATYEVMDWNWDSYLGHPDLKPMGVRPAGVAAAVFFGQSYYSVERFTAPVAGTYTVQGRWSRKEPASDGADVNIDVKGETIAGAVVNETAFEFGPEDLTLDAGDTIDFAVGPNKWGGGDGVARDIKILGPMEN